MSNTFFGNNMSKLDKIKLGEYEAERLKQEEVENKEAEKYDYHPRPEEVN